MNKYFEILPTLVTFENFSMSQYEKRKYFSLLLNENCPKVEFEQLFLSYLGWRVSVRSKPDKFLSPVRGANKFSHVFSFFIFFMAEISY